MKICISRIDRMGDMILTLPVIQAIKQKNPSYKIHVIASKKNIKILENFKYVDKTILFDQKNKFLYFFLKNIRKVNYNFFFNFSPGWKSLLLCLFSKTHKKANLILLSRYKNEFFSKQIIKFLSKIFFYKSYIVNRQKRLSKNLSIQQTEMMFKLLEKCNITFNQNTKLEKFIPQSIKLKASKKICLVHLSSRWINSYYKEKDLINLISILEKKFKIILTSDNSTKKKFFLIFDKFDKITNKNFIHFKFIEKTTILDNLNFLNWTQAIYSANLVITPECGCTHVAALCKIPSRIIYNPLNKPKAIQNEYAPWHSIYEKYTFDEENLNLKLSKNL